MRISVFGLGYVGTVSAGCLASDGHEVIGVDPVHTKADLINKGRSPIVEADISEIISSTVGAGRLRATDDPARAVRETELSFVCVGTPSQANGNLDLRYIRRICEQIGEALKTKTTQRRSGLPHALRSPATPHRSGESKTRQAAPVPVLDQSWPWHGIIPCLSLSALSDPQPTRNRRCCNRIIKGRPFGVGCDRCRTLPTKGAPS